MSEQEALVIPENARTPNYDKVTHDVKKLLTATAATYIPELCNALRKDLFPRATDNTFTRAENKNVRDEIRERILDDWSNERNWSESPWGDDTIGNWWPDWLRNPIAQEGTKVSRAAALAAKKYKQDLELQSSKIFSERSISQLPEVPKQLNAHEEEVEEPSSVRVTGLGTNEKYVPTPLEIYEGILHGYDRTWQEATGKDHIIPAGGAQDVFNLHIKPSRKLRLRLLKGLDKQRAIYFHNMTVSMEMLIKDILDMWDELKLEDTSKEIKQ